MMALLRMDPALSLSTHDAWVLRACLCSVLLRHHLPIKVKGFLCLMQHRRYYLPLSLCLPVHLPPSIIHHHAAPCSATQHHATPRSATQNHAASCSATQNHAASCSATQHHATPRSATQHHAAPYCTILHHPASPLILLIKLHSVLLCITLHLASPSLLQYHNHDSLLHPLSYLFLPSSCSRTSFLYYIIGLCFAGTLKARGLSYNCRYTTLLHFKLH